MTSPDPMALAFMDAYGIAPDSVEAKAFFERQTRPVRLVVNGECRPRIHLPTITCAKLQAQRAAKTFGAPSTAEAQEAGSVPRSASYPVLRVIAVVMVLGLVWMISEALVDWNHTQTLMARV